jgi:hypothetical protein
MNVRRTNSTSHTKQVHNITASKRYAKICRWLNKWNVLVALALLILATAAIATLVGFAVPLLR